MCPNTVFESCEGDITGESYNMPFVVFFISQFILGVSVSSYHSIGIAYLDDNLKKNEMPIYFGSSQYCSDPINDTIIQSAGHLCHISVIYIAIQLYRYIFDYQT